MLKVLYYGGSFDPPHLAHRRVLEAAIAAVQPDRALVVPTGNASSYKTRALSPAQHRLAMCELAFADLPQVQISSMEAHSLRPNYTMQTLEALEASLPQAVDWYVLLGSDQLAAIQTWHRWPDLLQKVCIVWADRAGLDASTQAQSRHNSALCPRLLRLDLAASDTSATALRQRLSVQPQDAQLAQWMAPAVLRYIAAHSLYSSI